MPKPVCTICQQEMKLQKVGVTVGFFAKSVGVSRPYEVYMADIHRCGGCSHMVICRFGDQPIFRHFHQEEPPKLDYKVYER